MNRQQPDRVLVKVGYGTFDIVALVFAQRIDPVDKCPQRRVAGRCQLTRLASHVTQTAHRLAWTWVADCLQTQTAITNKGLDGGHGGAFRPLLVESMQVSKCFGHWSTASRSRIQV